MTTFAVSMMKDEADIVAPIVRHMATQVDALIVADNGSTDGTRDLLADLARELPLTVVDDPEVGYAQSRKMTALAALAGGRGADWVVPFDADEWWYSPFGRIADVLGAIDDRWLVASATLYDHVATGHDGAGQDPTTRMVHRRRAPLPLPKVACRWRPDLVIEQGNHGARYGFMPAVLDGQLVVRHFPYRSVEQFIRKVRNGAAAYRAMGEAVPVDVGAHWRQWGQILDERGEEAVTEIFRKWYWRADPSAALVIDGERQQRLLFDPVSGL